MTMLKVQFAVRSVRFRSTHYGDVTEAYTDHAHMETAKEDK